MKAQVHEGVKKEEGLENDPSYIAYLKFKQNKEDDPDYVDQDYSDVD